MIFKDDNDKSGIDFLCVRYEMVRSFSGFLISNIMLI